MDDQQLRPVSVWIGPCSQTNIAVGPPAGLRYSRADAYCTKAHPIRTINTVIVVVGWIHSFIYSLSHPQNSPFRRWTCGRIITNVIQRTHPCELLFLPLPLISLLWVEIFLFKQTKFTAASVDNSCWTSVCLFSQNFSTFYLLKR